MVKTPCFQGLIPGQGTKIPQATWLSVKKKTKTKKNPKPKQNKQNICCSMSSCYSVNPQRSLSIFLMRLIQSNHTSLVSGLIHLTSVALAVGLGSQPSLFPFAWLQAIVRFDPDLLEPSLSQLVALQVVMLSGFASSPNRTNSPLVGPVAQTGHIGHPPLGLSLPTH